MAVKTRDELLNSMKAILGESTTDEALGLIEDVTDTFNDIESRSGEDWRTKYEENDSMWRKKYRDRFYGATDEEDFPAGRPKETRMTFEGLFKNE